MGVREVRLRLSSLGSFDARVQYRERLQAHLRANEALLSEDVRARIELNPLRAFDSDDEGTREVMRSAPRLLDELGAADAEHFAEVRALLDEASVGYEIDPTLVRGLDYYSRTVFEFTSDALGAQSGVGGGGRYDGLVEQLGGPPTPGIGWAAGVERILLAGEREHVVSRAASSCSSRSSATTRAAPHSACCRPPARPACARRWSSPDARSKASSATPTRSAPASSRSSKTARPCSKTCRTSGQERIPTDAVVHAVLRALRTL